MFKALLVDDEYWALLGMANSFPWAEAGIEIIGKVTNTHRALQIILDQKPEIVITDIRMPEMNGIDLIKLAREQGLDCEFIIVSGYGEFIYAQECMKYGAFSYILKPIDTNEMNETMQKLLLHLEHKKKIEVDNAQSKFMEFYVSNDEENMIELLLANGLGCQKEYYQAVTAYFPADEKDKFDTFIKQTSSCNFRIGLDKYTYIFNSNQDMYTEYSDFNRKNYRLNKDTQINIGFSSVYKDIKNLNVMIEESRIAFCDEFMQRGRGAYKYKDIDVRELQEVINNRLFGINTKDIDLLKNTVMGLFEWIIENDKGILELAFVYNHIIAFINRYDFNIGEQFDFGFTDYNSLYREYQDIYDLIKFFEVILDDVYSHEDTKPCNANKNFLELLAYVDDNFDKDIYLNDLSERFYLNPTYICDLFKEHIGKTLSNYILDLRMNKARYYLNNTSLTISEIGELVGYRDYSYFHKTFKKYYGVTPGNMRRGK